MALQSIRNEISLPANLHESTRKRKRRILDEDTFVEELDKIIERDFFPDLSKLKAQAQYQDAVEKNDYATLRELTTKFNIRTGPRRPDTGSSFLSRLPTPSTFETPVRTEKTKDSVRLAEYNEDESRDKKLSLNEFLSKYTSEDNESFEVIIEEAKKRHQVKYPWLYLNEEDSNRDVKQMLSLPSAEEQADKTSNWNVLTWNYKNRNSVMYYPEGVPLSHDEEASQAKKKPIVSHDNTRFHIAPFNANANEMAIRHAAHVQAQQQEGRIGIDGREMVAKDAPEVNGFGFVSMTPSPAPGVAESPLMTWGEIEGTPFRLDNSDRSATPLITPDTPQFKIPDMPSRDKIGLLLADRVAKQHRELKQSAVSRVKSSLTSPLGRHSPRTSIERLNKMSPAAQRLATLKLGVNKHSDSSLQLSYSPSPRANTPSTKIVPATSYLTPVLPTKTITNDRRNTPTFKSSLTDNLLDLNRRKKASQFF